MNDSFSLPAVGVFAELDEELRHSLAQAGERSVAPMGTYLASQGEPHQELTVLLSGSAVVTIQRGSEIMTVATLGAGETVGEMNIIDPHPASADVVITEKADIWSVSRQAFSDFIAQDADRGCIVLQVLARALCRRLRHNSDVLLHQMQASKASLAENDY